MLQLTDYDYDLPEHLVARYPSATRTGCRLLHLDKSTGACSDHAFIEMLNFLQSGDCLVLNDTKVIPARLYGEKESGGKIELLLERVIRVELAEREGGEQKIYCLVHIRANRAPKSDQLLIFKGGVRAQVISKQDNLYEIVFLSPTPFGQWLNVYGQVPLPPYLNRDAEALDLERYQTVFATQPGAVAAPTAGLHFDDDMLARIAERGIKIVRLTLHVGAGTFQPIKVSDVTTHKMHNEWMQLSQTTVDEINQCKAQGGRVVAVGTTSVRALESASRSGSLQAMTGDTDIFIYPGVKFNTVDAMLTNFHLPQSTLLLLISAFAGTENILRAYDHAVKSEYQFFSYGDAMWIA